jgi:hypothetical protein
MPLRTEQGASPKHSIRWGRVARNALLLPPAVLYVVVEHVFWAGAKRLLKQASRAPKIAALQRRLERLPAAAVLPMFLVPEILSHIGGFWASALLVRRHWVAAGMVGLFVKGGATLLEVWIYQSCESTLLSVKWFAWLHGFFLRGLDWVAERTKPMRRLIAGGRSGIARQFAALRGVMARRLGVARK